MASSDLSAERLRALLDFSPEKGVFQWRVSPSRNVRAGSRAGCLDVSGYRLISINRRLYKEHRLAWLYVHGRWPAEQIDHINGVRDDNRIANLREATNSENGQNRSRAQSNSKTGMLGVSRFRGQFQALIQIAGKRRRLGYFDTAEEAHGAYLAAKAKLHPFLPKAFDA